MKLGRIVGVALLLAATGASAQDRLLDDFERPGAWKPHTRSPSGPAPNENSNLLR